MIHLKRAYDKPSSSDGERILVERLWPRGLTKVRAALDLWLKDVAPVPSFANGSGTIRRGGSSLSGGIGRNCKDSRRRWKCCGKSRSEALLPLCTLPRTRNTIAPCAVKSFWNMGNGRPLEGHAAKLGSARFSRPQSKINRKLHLFRMDLPRLRVFQRLKPPRIRRPLARQIDIVAAAGMGDPDIGHVSGRVDFQHHDDERPIHIFQIGFSGEAQVGEFAGAHLAAGAGFDFAGENIGWRCG